MTEAPDTPNRPLPDFITPKQLAKHFGASERRIRADARRLGLCRILGKVMVLSHSDVAGLFEAWKPEPRIKVQPPRADARGDYESLLALRHLEKQARRAPAPRQSGKRAK